MASLEQLKVAVSDFPPFVESLLRNYLRHRCDTFAAGCIAHSLPAWRKITSDNEILSTVMGMKIDFDTTPRQKFLPNCTRSATKTIIIDADIQKLSSKRMIEPTARCFNEIISDGTHRMILNLKNLNQHANKLHFKMDTLNTITKLVDKNCFMASIDLKDAYYSVPIPAPHRKYLRFCWMGNLYQFTCLPN